MNVFKRTPTSKNYSVRFEHRGAQVLKSLKTPVKAEAERRAKEYFELITNAEWKDVRETLKDGIAGKPATATMREVMERYEAGATDVDSRFVNLQVFRYFLEGLFPNRKVEDLRVSELTRDLIRRYEQEQLRRVGTTWQRYPGSEPRVLTDYSVRTSIKSKLLKIRAIFGRGRMKYYEDLKLPDLTGFLTEPVSGPRQERKPKAPDEVAFARMLEAVPALKASRPDVYCAFLLMARQGMRPAEVECARSAWVRMVRGEHQMEIVASDAEILEGGRVIPAFKPKASERVIPVAADVWAELELFRDLRTDGYLVPGRTATDRHNVVDRELSKWVKQFFRGQNGLSTSYELRRWAGSAIMEANGGDPMAAKDFLGHTSYETTLKWYAYRIKKLKPLSMGGLLPAGLPALPGAAQG